MATPAKHSLPCIADFTGSLDGLQVIGMEVGPRQELYALALAAAPDYREMAASSGTSFAKLTTATPHDFVVLRSDGAGLTRFDIRGEHWNFHSVQPLPGDELLLVCGRCRKHGDGTHDKNARVYGHCGALRRDFLLGDGISRIQTTKDGRVWVGYFDEGVFGNFGWTEPVGAAGLLCWDAHGRRLFDYHPPSGTDSICDCYALNVASDDEIWIYYYTEFPLVRIRQDGEATVWRCPLAGSHCFAVHERRVLFQGGYRDRNIFRLFGLADGGAMTDLASLTFLDELGRPLQWSRAFSRGPSLYLSDGARCYRADIRDLV